MWMLVERRDWMLVSEGVTLLGIYRIQICKIRPGSDMAGFAYWNPAGAGAGCDEIVIYSTF